VLFGDQDLGIVRAEVERLPVSKGLNPERSGPDHFGQLSLLRWRFPWMLDAANDWSYWQIYVSLY